MAYPNLKKIYYHDPTNYEQIYKERFNAPTTIQFPLFIRTNYGNSHQLFITMLPQFIQVIEEISDKINKQIWFNKDNFPQAFLNDYIENLMFNEIIATNEIEGVYTKKEELLNTLANMDNTAIRFHFILQKYNKIFFEEEKITLKTPQDLRNIYDELLTNEIATEDLLDGRIFRKESVSVYKRTGRGKPIHTGVFPEEAIIDNINTLLLFLNSPNYSFYIKIAVAHYYLGYIHPCYDGNGRLSRFISTAFIAQEKDKLLALKLSKIIKDNIKRYDENFDLANSEYNRGELTSFVLMFLELLNAACDEINDEISYYTTNLKKVQTFLSQTTTLKDGIEKNIVLIIYQAEILDNIITIKELTKSINKTPDMTRKYVRRISDKGYLMKAKVNNKYTYYLSDKFHKEMNNLSEQ